MSWDENLRIISFSHCHSKYKIHTHHDFTTVANRKVAPHSPPRLRSSWLEHTPKTRTDQSNYKTVSSIFTAPYDICPSLPIVPPQGRYPMRPLLLPELPLRLSTQDHMFPKGSRPHRKQMNFQVPNGLWPPPPLWNFSKNSSVLDVSDVLFGDGRELLRDVGDLIDDDGDLLGDSVHGDGSLKA